MARNRTGRATEHRILTAIRALLASGGLDNVTISAICEHAGIRAGSFYNLFPSKEGAVLAVISHAIQAFDPDPEGAGGFTSTDLVDQYASFVENNPDLARIYMQLAAAGEGAGTDIAARIAHHNENRIARFAAAPGGPNTAAGARILVAGLNGLVLNWLVEPSIDLRGLAMQLVAATDGAAAGR